MKDSTFQKVAVATALIYSTLLFALSTFVYLNLEVLPIHSLNDFFAVVIAVATGAGILQFPSVLAYSVFYFVMEKN